MKYQAVIFDLDGTLTDTLADLADAINYAIGKFNCPAHPTEAYKQMIGSGLRNAISKALGSDKDHLIDEGLVIMKERYSQTCLDKTVLYDGISETVSKLHDMGIKMAVLTNKDQELARKIVSHFFEDDTFKCVIGAKNGYPVKPAPDKTFEVLGTLSAKPAQTIFVGDSGVDIQTAKAAGVFSVGVSWGLRGAGELKEHNADKIIDAAAELLMFF